ncbi:hypothetical protein [Helicobacter cetorum]|uniref:hypothetical protein n=1 Tax=Helicobacter cetorum TaxID=138563 RepID=UPI000CF0DB48|nr:hypothetical protein [Helicobacter cetorum]
MKYRHVIIGLAVAFSLAGCDTALSLAGMAVNKAGEKKRLEQEKIAKEQQAQEEARLVEEYKQYFKPMSEAEFKANMQSKNAVMWDLRCAIRYADEGSGDGHWYLLYKSFDKFKKTFQPNGSSGLRIKEKEGYRNFKIVYEKGYNKETSDAILDAINEQLQKDAQNEPSIRPTCQNYYAADGNLSKFKAWLKDRLKEQKEVDKENKLNTQIAEVEQKIAYFREHSDAYEKTSKELDNYLNDPSFKPLSKDKLVEFRAAYYLEENANHEVYYTSPPYDNSGFGFDIQIKWLKEKYKQKQANKAKAIKAKKAAEEKAKKNKQEEDEIRKMLQ